MEKRTSRRSIYVGDIVYALKNDIEQLSAENEKFGVIIDISNSGICIYSAQPIREGQKLVILKGGPTEDKLPAEVKWVKQVSGNLYRAGLMLL